MQVIKLLPPKMFSLHRFRVTTRLPEAPLPVPQRLGAQGLGKASGSVPGTIVAQLPARELVQIGVHDTVGPKPWPLAPDP